MFWVMLPSAGAASTPSGREYFFSRTESEKYGFSLKCYHQHPSLRERVDIRISERMVEGPWHLALIQSESNTSRRPYQIWKKWCFSNQCVLASRSVPFHLAWRGAYEGRKPESFDILNSRVYEWNMIKSLLTHESKVSVLFLDCLYLISSRPRIILR